ncbi:hypothetical protein SXCC_00119 [Gluconacetobacter sp. SXCC-1]|nr:hypothetical protein SXCC_00119 [Gluconacetobacter sp. SXCC-1]
MIAAAPDRITLDIYHAIWHYDIYHVTYHRGCDDAGRKNL